ncbi:MAG: PocR ligand-binding domain-containing protein [Planctomycetaceae bacterium]|nr:PocR ligand-binding domain-containing protein [Planctomycetaceae bacterium]
MDKLLFTKEEFSKIQAAFAGNFALPIETTGTDGKCVSNLCSKNCNPEFCKIVLKSPAGAKRCHQDRLRSLKMAFETGQPYITICHAGIVLACVPIMDRDKPLGGIFFGKCLWNAPDEILIDDIDKRLKGIRINRQKLRQAIEKLPILAGRKIHEAAEFLFVLLYESTGLDPYVVQWRRQRSQQQSEIGELIKEHKEETGAGQYPLEAEKQLMEKVRIGDRTGAKEVLNMILASIMLKDPGNISVLKARMLELLSILGRSAVEGGVDINFMLEKNLDYINKVLQIDSQQDLCAWISNALNDFVELVYSIQDKRRVSQIKPATDFISQHFNEQITLEDVAHSAHLSVSRLSHIFKEQTGLTIVDYITKSRIEYAKELLISTNKNCTEICFDTGYNNQSYFTRTFKEVTGMTPRQFREMNRRK